METPLVINDFLARAEVAYAERVAAQYNAANPKAPKAFTLSVWLAEVA